MRIDHQFAVLLGERPGLRLPDEFIVTPSRIAKLKLTKGRSLLAQELARR